MRYYLIVGEASGDLHASHLMTALSQQDSDAEFRFYGGEQMRKVGGTLVQHYRDLAYMGFIPVLLHLRTILRGMKRCRQDILTWKPDVLILVDYPGFNLQMARYIKSHSKIPIYYYISPKIWAWKEYRIRDIRRDVDELFSILPFEVDFYEKKHHFPIHYVGNPTVDEVDVYLGSSPADDSAFRADNGLDSRPVIALLAGSRRQEIKGNLDRMIQAAEPYTRDYQLILAAASGIDDEFYRQFLEQTTVKMLRDQTYRILQHSTAALVTSGTATLETALFRVPQVVCYYTKAGRLASLGKKMILKIPYISLVNLIAESEVVPELLAEKMTVENVRHHLSSILPGGSARQSQLDGYEYMAQRLGPPGAPRHAAELMVRMLRERNGL
ncbi:MAG: lipid-A-disaccharide synthase [Bacteroidaceae bacterium]|nr:lipid-A-disaccharide synthase [Bacteroidaceae bacterium]